MIKIKGVLKHHESLLIAGYFLVLALLILLRNIITHDLPSIFWICDIAPFIIAYGFWKKNYQMIKGVISVGLIGQTLFLINFIILITSGISIGHVADIFTYSRLFLVLSLILHMSLAIALFFVYKIRPERKSLEYSAGFIVAIYILTLFFTHQSNNINYVYSLPPILSTTFLYTMMWPLLTFLIVALPTYYLQLKLYEFHKRKKKI